MVVRHGNYRRGGLATRATPAGAFSPPDTPGLATWFDASDATTVTLNGTDVSSFVDKSGNAITVSQATPADQPPYQLGAQNGLNIISFDGVTDFLRGSFSPNLGLNWHAFMVVSQKDITPVSNETGIGVLNTSGQDFSSEDGAGMLSSASASAGRLQFYRNSDLLVVSSIAATAAFQIVESRLSSTPTFELLQDSVSGGTDNTFVNTGTNPLEIIFGAEGIGIGSQANFMDFALCEMLIYTEIKSGATLQSIYSYLAPKWGIS